MFLKTMMMRTTLPGDGFSNYLKDEILTQLLALIAQQEYIGEHTCMHAHASRLH